MWNELGEFLTQSGWFYLVVAVAGTIIFIVQFLLSLCGAHHGDFGGSVGEVQTDVDVPDGNGGEIPSDIATINFFSLSSITAFMTFFGWGGVFWGKLGVPGFLIAVAGGAMMMVLTSLVIWLLLKARQSGNIMPRDIVGQTGTVYLPIPAGGQQSGRVTVKLAGCTREIKAVSVESIATGTPVTVTAHVEGDCYQVKPYHL